MKSFSVKQITVSVSLLLLAACSGSSSSDDSAAQAALTASQQATLTLISDKVIVPTYADLAAKSSALKDACYALAATPSAVKLEAAKAAWIATRIPWERSEAFLFGPVEDNGYDPKMDSWPLDNQVIAASIATNVNAPVNIDQADPSVKGFHAIEFLLWGANHSKTFDQITPNEFVYLKNLVDNHADTTSNLAKSWSTGVDTPPVPYAYILSTSGSAENKTFTSSSAGMQQVIEAMADIANEVGSSKINGPYKDQDPTHVESQYSWNSLEDFQDNIRSIQNVYFGSLDGTTIAAGSLSAMTKTANSDLDAKIQAQFTKTIVAIKAIPEPFRDSISSAAAKPAIEAAVTENANLNTLINVDLKKALLGF